jgi:hypothetical protein
MGQYNDVMMIEGVDGHEAEDEREYMVAIQRQVNAGSWSLQGSHGRTMMQAIENGDVLLGRMRAKDYWGHVIPGRDDVSPGTKGSREYVAAAHDEEWAAHMEAQA